MFIRVAVKVITGTERRMAELILALVCMNIGSVLNRLSPVQGKYRPINYECVEAEESREPERKLV